MHDTLQFLRMFARFPFALRRFARSPLTAESARAIIRERMARRAETLARIVEHSVYGRPRSPYLALLRHAGCELGDFRSLIDQHGVEGGLARLRDAGVHVKFEEFKGRAPIVRDGLELPVTPRDFDNPHAHRDFTVRTGGSTGLPTLVSQDLDHIAYQAPMQMVLLEACGLVGAPAAHWMHIMPGTGFRFLLQRAFMAQWSEHWFSSLGWHEHGEWPRFTAATYYLVAVARARGLRIPFPEYVPVQQAIKVARWMSGALEREGRCMLTANVSHAMRVALAARDARLVLEGATFRIGGEPVTPAKADFIRSLGARIIPGYGMVEVSNIGLGCPNGIDSGDLHVSMDSVALITKEEAIGDTGITVPAFLLTTLSDTAGKLMLNVQVDDCGIVEERRCGCAFEECGMDVHIRDVRSYTKLVGEGVTLIGNEMVRILEHVLPSRFGGSALDYQLIEEEDEHGLTRLSLLVSPRVGTIAEQDVIGELHRALRESSAAGGVASAQWRQSDSIRIRREEPVWTSRGKLMPLHIEKYAQRPAASASSAREA